MLRNLLHKKDDEGFTLIELLVVILIIGILAAIALPSFIGQSDKAKDSSAKSNARNMVSQVESCYTATSTYADCDGTDPALDKGGIVADVSAGTTTGYVVTATSTTGNTFTITKTANGATRTCSAAGSAKGGCSGSAW